MDIWFARGDVVSVMDDMAEVTKLQQGHGEWNEHMAMVNHSIARLLHTRHHILYINVIII